MLTNRPPKRARNSLPTIFMKPAETTRSGSYAAVASASAASHSLARGVVLHPAHEGGQPGALGALEPAIPSRSAPTATIRAP